MAITALTPYDPDVAKYGYETVQRMRELGQLGQGAASQGTRLGARGLLASAGRGLGVLASAPVSVPATAIGGTGITAYNEAQRLGLGVGGDYGSFSDPSMRRSAEMVGPEGVSTMAMAPEKLSPGWAIQEGPTARSPLDMMPSHTVGAAPTATQAIAPNPTPAPTPAVSARRLVMPDVETPARGKFRPAKAGQRVYTPAYNAMYGSVAEQRKNFEEGQTAQQKLPTELAGARTLMRKDLAQAGLEEAKLTALQSGDMAKYGQLIGRESKEAKAPKVLGFNVAQKTTRLGEIVPGVSSVSFGDYGTIDMSPERADAVNKGMDIALTQYLSKDMSYDEAQNAAIRDVYGEFRRTNQGSAQ